MKNKALDFSDAQELTPWLVQHMTTRAATLPDEPIYEALNHLVILSHHTRKQVGSVIIGTLAREITPYPARAVDLVITWLYNRK